jgi:hypothetical protein
MSKSENDKSEGDSDESEEGIRLSNGKKVEKLLNYSQLVDSTFSISSSLNSRSKEKKGSIVVESETRIESYFDAKVLNPLISLGSIKECKEKFIGRLVGCPDKGTDIGWVDTKSNNFKSFGMSELVILETQEEKGKSTIYNLYKGADHLFQEFILDLALGFGNCNIFAFGRRGAYLRDKEGKWEAFSQFIDLKTDISEGELGGSYDLQEAYPRNMEILFASVDSTEMLDVMGYSKLLWSKDRMAPFEVEGDSENSRILSHSFFPRNGVGYKRGDEAPDPGADDYLEVMSIFLARKVMSGLPPLYPVSVFEIARRLSRGMSVREAIRVREMEIEREDNIGLRGEDITSIPRSVTPPQKNKKKKHRSRGTRTNLLGHPTHHSSAPSSSSSSSSSINRISDFSTQKSNDKEIKFGEEAEKIMREGDLEGQVGSSGKRKRLSQEGKGEAKEEVGVKKKRGTAEGEETSDSSSDSSSSRSDSNDSNSRSSSSGSEHRKRRRKSKRKHRNRKERKMDRGEDVGVLDEIGFSGMGIPLPADMKAKLKSNIVVEESGKETSLGKLHSLSSLRYTPSPTSFKVTSTGEFLKRFLGSSKKFDPFCFALTREAKSAEEAREKTLCVDFVVARSPPRQPNEDPILPNASEMLAKCYNRFLFIARCMEVGDERAVWMTIKDGIFSTAHNLTRVHDARMTISTGSRSYTNKASSDDGMIREKTRKRLRKENARKDGFFQLGGGRNNPPVQSYQSSVTDFNTYDILPPYYDQEDLLVGSVLAPSPSGTSASRGRGMGNNNLRRGTEGFRGRPAGRGGGPMFPPQQIILPPVPGVGQQRRFRGRGGGGNGQGRGGGGGNAPLPAYGDGGNAQNQAGSWGNG